MTAIPLSRAGLPRPAVSAPVAAAGVAFLVLFWQPMVTLVRDWLHDPDAGHGLLLAPIAAWMVWRRGVDPQARPQPVPGLLVLGAAVLLRYLSGLAAELFTMRFSLLLAAAGLVVWAWGARQVLRWWLPAALLMLAIPLPAVLTGTLALPLQFQASRLGAAMLEWRHVPVEMAGNIILLPGRSLFVTEACSGLRSLSALLALGLLIGALWLRTPWARALLILLAIPVAVVLNGVRIFLTGFLVHFVNPSLGDGLMHYTEGWAIFVVAFLCLGAFAWGFVRLENLRRPVVTA